MLWLLAILAANAKSPCKDLKPKHKPSTESVQAVGSLLQTALGVAGVAIPVSPASLASVLASGPEADITRSWFLYQVCTLTEAGLLSPEKAQELVASSLAAPVGAPPSSAPNPAGEMTPPSGMSLQIAAARQGFVDTVAIYCSPRLGPEYAAGCTGARQMLAEFDEQYLK